MERAVVTRNSFQLGSEKVVSRTHVLRERDDREGFLFTNELLFGFITNVLLFGFSENYPMMITFDLIFEHFVLLINLVKLLLQLFVSLLYIAQLLNHGL